MRHRRAGSRLTRTSSHRDAMLRNLAAAVFEHGQITTTIPKAKAVQPLVEKIITDAKKGDLASRRRVIAKLGGDRQAFEWMYLPKKATEEEKNHVNQLREFREGFFPLPKSEEVERNRYGELRKAPKLVKHIFDNVAPKFADRPGGYTRIVKLGRHRIGDAAELCVLQFVGNEEGPEIGGKPSTRRRTADKRTAFAAKVRKSEAKS
ncbi:MAG: 50S ribosomal protein L17 [Phycisphaerales bacterium]|nr:50S ribosomal protein L17 [Phycisphaerales bacterium]